MDAISRCSEKDIHYSQRCVSPSTDFESVSSLNLSPQPRDNVPSYSQRPQQSFPREHLPVGLLGHSCAEQACQYGCEGGVAKCLLNSLFKKALARVDDCPVIVPGEIAADGEVELGAPVDWKKVS